MLSSGQMKKNRPTSDPARRRGARTRDAADEMDRAVTEIIRTLKGGHPARLPGLGTISPGKHLTFHQDKHEC